MSRFKRVLSGLETRLTRPWLMKTGSFSVVKRQMTDKITASKPCIITTSEKQMKTICSTNKSLFQIQLLFLRSTLASTNKISLPPSSLTTSKIVSLSPMNVAHVDSTVHLSFSLSSKKSSSHQTLPPKLPNSNSNIKKQIAVPPLLNLMTPMHNLMFK